jgi:glycosyltransferase involved in cell wall biosynthesis
MRLLIVLPCLNEEEVLERSVLLLQKYLLENLREYDWQIVMADNNSSDRTAEIGKNLAIQYSRVYYFYLDKIGKGLAVLSAWQKFRADLYVFMDTDLSTDLAALKPLVEAVAKHGFDLVVGSRYLPGSQVKRTKLRQLCSLGFRILLKIFFQLKIKDAPSGFKAVNQKVVQNIVPLVKNKEWFFDTEMLVLAQKQGCKIKEIPVKWQEGERETKVKVFSLSWKYLQAVIKLFFRLIFSKI